MRIAFLLIVVTAFSVNAKAQTLNVDDKPLHWEFDFGGGLNTDGVQVDLGLAYFPVQFFGFKASIGGAGEIKEMSDWGKDEWETGHHYTLRFKFIPSLVFRTGRIINWKRQGGGIYLFAEPGLILSPGAEGSKKAKTLNWDFRTGINLQVEACVFFVGYGVSNYSLYSGRPISHWARPEKDNYKTYAGFIGLGYKF